MNKILKYVLLSLTVLAILVFFFMLKVGMRVSNYSELIQIILVVMVTYCSLSSVMRYFMLPKTAEDKDETENQK